MNANAQRKTEELQQLEESEPYLGPWWALLMLVLFLVKEAFPAETFSLWWCVQLYVITVMIVITLFVIYKRLKYFRKKKKKQ